MPRETRRSPPCTLGKHTHTTHWSDETEERRLVEEEGSLTKKTWLQKKEDRKERVSSCPGPSFPLVRLSSVLGTTDSPHLTTT